MKEDQDQILIQRYLAGELSEDERRELVRRLEREQPLQELLDWYRALEDHLHSFPETELPEGLWKERLRPALEQRLRREPSFWEKLLEPLDKVRGFLLQPAVVVAVFVVVIVGITLLVQPMLTIEREQTPEQQQAEQAMTEIQQLREQVLAKIDELAIIMEERKVEMSNEMVQVYEQTLVKIDESIAAAERYFFAYPDDPDAVDLLFASYERKGQFLRQFINMEL